MNRSLLSSVHGLAALLVVGGFAALAAFGPLPVGRAPQGQRDYLLWSGWIALALYLAAYAYVLRKYAHKLGYSPEFGLQVRKESMDAAQQKLGALRDRVAARSLADKGQILAAARGILRETGCAKVLEVRVARDEAGLLRLETRRTEPLARTARWLHAHAYYGLGAGLLSFLHGGARFETPMGVALNGLTILVLASGVVGLGLWMAGPAWLTREERDLSIEEAFVLDRHYARKLEAERARLAETDPALAAEYAASRPAAADLGARLQAACGGGADGEKRSRDLLALAGQRRRVASELRRLERVRFAINAWRPVHLPASIALLAAILVHVVSIWLY